MRWDPLCHDKSRYPTDAVEARDPIDRRLPVHRLWRRVDRQLAFLAAVARRPAEPRDAHTGRAAPVHDRVAQVPVRSRNRRRWRADPPPADPRQLSGHPQRGSEAGDAAKRRAAAVGYGVSPNPHSADLVGRGAPVHDTVVLGFAPRRQCPACSHHAGAHVRDRLRVKEDRHRHTQIQNEFRDGADRGDDSGIVEAEVELEVRPGAGSVVDQRGSPTANEPFEKSADTATEDPRKPSPNE